jgi:site-specific DNA-cytosine methylase
MRTSASLFTGGGLFDIGAMEAGYKPIWGIEWDDKIAAVARLNGLPVMTGDVVGYVYDDCHLSRERG